MINHNVIEEMLKKINFDRHYIEATFQFKLLMQLAKIFPEDSIWPERNIEYYKLDKKELIKKEIDIAIGDEAVIELKMPMNGQIPEQMFKFVEDIKFLEQLKAKQLFKHHYLIAVTNDSDFWLGDSKTQGTDIYSYFRAGKTLTGSIKKPTGAELKKNIHTLAGKYSIVWKNINNGFRYFMVEV